MTSIAERLRSSEVFITSNGMTSIVAHLGADEIETLQSAIYDMAKNIWRGDWNRLEQETRDVVERVMKEKGERNVL